MLFANNISQEKLVSQNELRGNIYDRNGNILATSIESISLSINPQKIKNKEFLSSKLSKILDLESKIINNKLLANKKFVWLKRNITPIEYQNIINLGEINIRSHKEYNYGKFLLPHDGKVRELGTGISRADTLHNLGINCTIMKRTSPEERIHASRMAFDRMWFDKENCKEALRSLRQYRYEWNDKARIFQKRPVHDWTSHFADSFGLSAEGLNLSKPRKDLPQRDKSWIV